LINRKRNTTTTAAILKGVSGTGTSGQLTAIMGPSGGGKSTLLDILAKRKEGEGGTTTGQVSINGHDINTIDGYKGHIGYVTQEDVFIPTMTVYETVLFYANMCLPFATGGRAKADRVLRTLEILELDQVKDTAIGGELPGGLAVRGISGGQKRRVSIACALVRAPRVLFLDEPTSGLDSAAARVVMRVLRSVAQRQNKLVVCSIHQPRASIYYSFDSVIVLGGGHTLYNGAPQDTVAFIKRNGGKFDEFDNPADVLLDFVANLDADELKAISDKEFADEKGVPVEKAANASLFGKVLKVASTIANRGRRSSQSASFGRGSPVSAATGGGGGGSRTPSTIVTEGNNTSSTGATDAASASSVASPTSPQSPLLVPGSSNDGAEVVPLSPTSNSGSEGRPNPFAGVKLDRPNMVLRFLYLLQRALLETMRNPMNLFVRFLVMFFMSIIIGVVFYNMGFGLTDITSKVYMMYFALVLESLLPFTTISIFLDTRRFFNRERAQKLYSPFEYYSASMTLMVLQCSFNSFVYATIIYFMVGLDSDFGKYFQNILVHNTFHITSVSLVIAVGNLAPNADVTFAGSAFFVVIHELFSGALISISSMKDYTKWLRWISIYKYAFEFLYVLIYLFIFYY